MNGIYAFLLGIAAILGAFIFGKVKGSSETKTKISGQVTIEQQKREKAETERDLAVSAAQTVSVQTAEGNAINEAQDKGNTLYAIEAAKKLAERAEQWRKRNNP